MKNSIQVLVVALTTLVFSGLSFAQAKPTTPATPASPGTEKKPEMKSEKSKTHQDTGEVKSLDAKAGTLTVKAKDKDLNLTAESKSTKSALEKIKVGDTVRVSYTEKEGKMIATSVKAESKSKAATSEKATEKKSEMTEKKTETK